MSAAALTAKPALNPWILAIIVSIATFMEVLDTTITNVSITHIAGSLGADQDQSTWVLTSYLVANGIVLPLSGWLSDYLGQKRFFLICIAGFTIASFMCGAATSLGMLIFFRLLQGLAGGGLQPTQQAIILDLFPPEKRGAVFGITGVTLILAPIIGPTLGGWITDNFDWRWIFFINIPVGITLFMLISAYLPESEHRSGKRIDFIGMGLLALGLGALQIMLDKGQQEDWFNSNLIITLTVITVISLTSAVVWLFKSEEPIVNLRLMKIPSFGISWILIFFTGFSLYGSTALLPLLLQSHFGYDATTAGLVISPGGIVIIAFMALAGRLINKVPVRNLVMFGLALSTLGMINSMIHIDPDMSYEMFVWVRISQVMGIPFLFLPVSAAAFMHVPKEQNNKASALFSLSRNLGGSFGIALMTAFLSRQTQMAQARMVEHANPANPIFQQAMQQLTGVYHSTKGAMAHLYMELNSQASLIAYRNTFGLLACVMAFGVFLALFLPSKPAAAAPGGAH